MTTSKAFSGFTTERGRPGCWKLAEKCHKHGANWTSGVINWHGVNISQGFREPANFYVQSKDAKHLAAAAERNYNTVMDLYRPISRRHVRGR